MAFAGFFCKKQRYNSFSNLISLIITQKYVFYFTFFWLFFPKFIPAKKTPK
jgi:hypothetical protein